MNNPNALFRTCLVSESAVVLSVSQGDTNEESLGDVEDVNDNVDILSRDQTELDADATTEVEVPTPPAIECTHT